MSLQDGPLHAANFDEDAFSKSFHVAEIGQAEGARNDNPEQSCGFVLKSILGVAVELLWTMGYYGAFISACTLAANCYPWAAVLPLTTWSACRICAVYTRQERRAVLKLIGIAVMTGYVVDTALAVQPWLPIRVNECARLPFGPEPFWMLTFWVGYGTFVDWVRPLLGGRWIICVLLGAIFGPSSYLLGRQIGGISFADRATWLIAIEHGSSFPFLIWSSMYYRRDLSARFSEKVEVPLPTP